ncbi:MAG: hypothetical protein HOV81_32520 [Kofleriaceae bacterium]|nr:hypothetical protein [Kofleriaceae bacterium]
MPSITIAGRDNDSTVQGMIDRCRVVHRAGTLDELRGVLEVMPATPGATLDLVGHSTKPARLLRLDQTVIDMFDQNVSVFFQRLADDGVLARIGVVSLRLLGCETASRPPGKRTIQRLARVLRLPVYGTTKPIMKSHYTAEGFNPAFAHLLRESAQLG